MITKASKKNAQKETGLISLFLQGHDNKGTLTLGDKDHDAIVSNYSQFSGQEIVDFLLPQQYDSSKDKMCFGDSKAHASFKRSMDKDHAILKAIAEFDRDKKIENIANLYVAMINAYYRLYNELSISFYSIKSSDPLFSQITTIPEKRESDFMILHSGDDNEVTKLVQRDIRTYGLFPQYNKIPLDMTNALVMDDNIISSVKTLRKQKNWISGDTTIANEPELLSSVSRSLWDYIKENKQIIKDLKEAKDAKDVFKVFNVLKENIVSQINKFDSKNDKLQNIVSSLTESEKLIVDKDILDNIQNQDILKAILLYNMFVLKNTMIDVIDRNKLSENDINEMLWVQKNSEKETRSNVLLFGYKTGVFTRHECLMLVDQYCNIEYLKIDKTLKTKYDSLKNQLSSMDEKSFRQSLSSMNEKYDSVKNKLSSMDEDSQSKGKSFFSTVLLLVLNWIKSSFTKKTVEVVNSKDSSKSQPQDFQEATLIEQNINNAPEIPADKETLIITKIYNKDKGYYVKFQNGDDLLGCGQGYEKKDDLLEVQNSRDIQGLIQNTTIIKSMIDQINTISTIKRTEIELTQALNVYGVKNTKQSFAKKVQEKQKFSLNI